MYASGANTSARPAMPNWNGDIRRARRIATASRVTWVTSCVESFQLRPEAKAERWLAGACSVTSTATDTSGRSRLSERVGRVAAVEEDGAP